MTRTHPHEMLQRARAVIFDFDGTIKDSVAAKGGAFVELFSTAPVAVQHKIHDHHVAHGGVSRFEKLPLYAAWAGVPRDEASLARLADSLSKIMIERVVSSPWISGHSAIWRLHEVVPFVGLASATPLGELSTIVSELGLRDWFDDVWGHPTTKQMAIIDAATRLDIPMSDVLLVGDSADDATAASESGAMFVGIGHRVSSQCSEPDLTWLVGYLPSNSEGGGAPRHDGGRREYPPDR